MAAARRLTLKGLILEDVWFHSILLCGSRLYRDLNSTASFLRWIKEQLKYVENIYNVDSRQKTKVKKLN